MKTVNLMSIMFITLSIIFCFSSCKKSNEQPSTESKAQEKYVLTINDNKLRLILDNDTIKEYDVNINVLPGEDIKLLMDGIIVNDIQEADSIAENFDG